MADLYKILGPLVCIGVLAYIALKIIGTLT